MGSPENQEKEIRTRTVIKGEREREREKREREREKSVHPCARTSSSSEIVRNHSYP